MGTKKLLVKCWWNWDQRDEAKVESRRHRPDLPVGEGECSHVHVGDDEQETDHDGNFDKLKVEKSFKKVNVAFKRLCYLPFMHLLSLFHFIFKSIPWFAEQWWALKNAPKRKKRMHINAATGLLQLQFLVFGWQVSWFCCCWSMQMQ